MRRIVFLVLVVLFAFVKVASARMSDKSLDKETTITEEAALLSQVDAVSLYLTSDQVAYAPRLNDDRVIEVEATVLSDDLVSDRGRLEHFISRQIDTFISVLKERLPEYAPSVAKEFKPSDDMVFIVNATPKRIPVAVWSKGKWKWDEAWQQGGMVTSSTTTGSKKLGCDCPARSR